MDSPLANAYTHQVDEVFVREGLMVRQAQVSVILVSWLCVAPACSSDTNSASSPSPIEGTYEGVATDADDSRTIRMTVRRQQTAQLGLPWVKSAWAQDGAFVVDIDYGAISVTGDLRSGELTFTLGALTCTGELLDDGRISGSCTDASGATTTIYNLVQLAGAGQRAEVYCGVTAFENRLGFIVTDATQVLAAADNSVLPVTVTGSQPATLSFEINGRSYTGTLDAALNLTPDGPNWIVQECTSIMGTLEPPVPDMGPPEDMGDPPDMGEPEDMAPEDMPPGDMGGDMDDELCDPAVACCPAGALCATGSNCCTLWCQRNTCAAECKALAMDPSAPLVQVEIREASSDPIVTGPSIGNPLVGFTYVLTEEVRYEPGTPAPTPGPSYRATMKSLGGVLHEVRDVDGTEQRFNGEVAGAPNRPFSYRTQCDSTAGGVDSVPFGSTATWRERPTENSLTVTYDFGGGRGLERTFRFTPTPVPMMNEQCHAVAMDAQAMVLGWTRSGAQQMPPRLVGPSISEGVYVLEGLTYHSGDENADLGCAGRVFPQQRTIHVRRDEYSAYVDMVSSNLRLGDPRPGDTTSEVSTTEHWGQGAQLLTCPAQYPQLLNGINWEVENDTLRMYYTAQPCPYTESYRRVGDLP